MNKPPLPMVQTFSEFTINEWKNGSLLKESHYSRTGSTYKLINSTQNLYAEFKPDSAVELKVRSQKN